MRRLRPVQRLLLIVPLLAAVFLGASSTLIGTCGPFTDVAGDAFCPFVLEIFYLGITTGITPTTYDPASSVSRLQMAAFLSRSVDGVLKRGSRRAAMNQFWTPQNGNVLGVTTVGSFPTFCVADGADVWVGNGGPLTVSRVRANDGKLLETWTGVNSNPNGLLAAMGRILIASNSSPGKLYSLDPSQPAGAVTEVANNLGNLPTGIAFDGARIWTANLGSVAGNGSVSIVTPGAIPWPAITVTTGFSNPFGALFDGANVWVTDAGPGTLLRLDASGGILQTVTVGSLPLVAAFDGTNIWVPNRNSDSVTVVRASSGAILQTLTGNGLDMPFSAAFDGERVLITDFNSSKVSLWKAADLTPLGSPSTGINTNPGGACSDGVNFWLALSNVSKLARF